MPSAYDTLVLSRASLKHFYKLNEASGSTINDSKGALNGTIVGGVTLGASGIFTANDDETVAQFDGSTGYITFPDIFGGDANYTYECQYYQTADSGAVGDGFDQNTILQNGNGEGFSDVSGSGHGHQISGGDGGSPAKVNLKVKNLQHSGTTYQGTSTFAYPVPRHLMITFDGSDLRFYVNGALDRVVAATPGTPATCNFATAFAFIGASIGGLFGSVPGGYFTGKIAKIAYYNTVLSADDATAAYLAAITAPTPPANQNAPDYDIRMYGPDYLRKALSSGGCDADMVHTARFEYLERGGFAQGDLEMLATWEHLQLTGNEHFDIYLFNEIAYRGFVRMPENDIEVSEMCRVTMYGLMETLNQWQITRKYAYGCPTDLSVVFTDIVADFVNVTGRLVNLVIEANSTGVLVQTFDARNKSVSQAMNQLCDIAPGQVMWGFDVDSAGIDRIYFRVKSQTVTYKHIIGKNVEAFIYPRDTSTIVNRLFISGGKVDQPNLLTNGDFSDVEPSSAEVNNLCFNYSFEDNPNTFWSLNAGATIKDPSVGATAHGAARTGDHWLELDQTGENAVSSFIKVDYTKVYVASLWTRYEDAVASSGDLVTISVQGYDSGGSTVALAVLTSPNLDPQGDIYKNYTLSVDFTAYSTVAKVKITITGSGGTASNDGILVDDVGFWQHCAVGQKGWRMSLDGNAVIQTLDWAVKNSPVPFRGNYCIGIDATDIAINSDAVTFDTPKDFRISVKPNERYTVLLRWQTNGHGLGVISLGAVPYKSDGTAQTVQESSQISQNMNEWTLATFPIMTASDTTELQVFFRSRSNTPTYFSSIMCVEGAEPSGVVADDDYWTGTAYELPIDVEDTDLHDLLVSGDCNAEQSINTYGEHEMQVSNDNVYNRDTALALAKDYFKAHGCPQIQASLTVKGPTYLMKQAGTVKLVNLPSAPSALFPTRIQYKIDGANDLSMMADLGNDRPEMVTLLNLPARVI